ncbi:M16 family metallopeptidase [Sporosalibacterium faouarense]|uniref:M16 family metallopeptidase n=1 Tax=Sporosalibacterium faouarense TaxID=516123 RepID=UPI00192C8D91|nr:pitrilysin family protein [Sporosalibacterium faouarense]
MYDKFNLNNGVRVVTEKIPHVKSVSIGVWIEAGSRYENSNNNGTSHFIEHMLFKGTEKRTAKQIAESIDNIGGQLNAFTSKECTCFYAKVLDNHLPIAIDVLSDMLLNSKFDEEEIKKEQSVVVEEINMYDDSPEDVAHDLLSKTIFDGNSLALPILGDVNTVKNLTRKDIIDFFNMHYIPGNTVISIAGNFDMVETRKLLEESFGNWHVNGSTPSIDLPPKLTQRLKYKSKDTEQLHLCLGLEGVSQGSDELYSLLVLNNVFGGSMSSRLFQRVREERGLVYSIFSYPSSYKNVGIFTIYAGLNPNQLLNVTELILEDINDIKDVYLSKDEIYRSKEQLKGNYILGLESTSSRMTSLGKSELLLGKINSPREILEKIDKVSLEGVKEVTDRVFNFDKLNIAYVGKIKNKKSTNEKIRDICFK